MWSILSKTGQKLLAEPAGVRRLNRWLLAAVGQCRSIHVGDLCFTASHLHVGRGVLDAGFTSGLHTHAYMQLEYVLFGAVNVLVEDTELGTLHPGEGILLPPGLEHGLQVHQPSALLGALLRVDGLGADTFCTRCAAACCRPDTRMTGEQAQVWAAQMIDSAAQDDLSAWSVETVAELMRLWLRNGIQALAAQALPGSGRQGDGAPVIALHDQHDALCERALAFIRANANRAIRAEDVSHDLGISPRHLNRLFRSALSETVTQSITRHRLTRARRLLASDPSLQIKEAASAAGYDNAAYFSYCFHRHFGCPPSQVSRAGAGRRKDSPNEPI